MLSTAEKTRYSRHIDLANIGLHGQEKIKAARVLIIGVGGLGCTVALQLTAAGIGHIGLVDGDVVSISNLQRQILFTAADAGKLKVKIAHTFLQKQNEDTQFSVYANFLTTENASDIFRSYDIVIDCTDDIKTKLLCNSTCLAQNKPLIYGALYKFEGQMSTFNFEGGPTYTDAFPNLTESSLVPACSAIGVYAIIPHIIASLQANEALKIILGIGHVSSGELITFDALTNTFNQIKFFKQ